MLKKTTFLLLTTIFLTMNSTGAFAHGVTYTSEMVGEHTLRVTLNASDPAEQGKIAITSFVKKGYKNIEMAYEVLDHTSTGNIKDFNLNEYLPPVRILLFNTKDYDKPVFSDVDGHSAEEYIHHLHDAGIISGRPDGTFHPNDSITRAEFMVMMVNALKLKGQASNTQGFTDIETHWAKNTMLLAAKQGIISGFPDKTLRPGKAISAAEVCSIISRGFDFHTAANGIYGRLKPGQWYSSVVKRIFDGGILSIKDTIYGNFDETADISRADCVMMISRALTANEY